MSTLMAASAVVPSVASAGPLLSGYGGPGAGNQVILGSALIGGAGGGGGSTGGSSGSSGPPSAPGAATTGAGGATSSGTGGHGSSTRGGSSQAAGARGASHRNGAPAGSSARTNLALSREASSQPSSGGALGLSGVDLVYLLLAIGALAFTGFVTGRLARAPVRPEGP
ncbi:MAG: hypothetical protein ACRDK7_09080 [Solirubrobacteraceae bacterium]